MKRALHALVGLVVFATSFGSLRSDCTTSVPLFDLSGPMCLPENQPLSCQCSECLQWDSEVNATSYDINRQTVSVGTYTTVGTITETSGVDENGDTYSVPPVTQWCFAKDSAFPHESVLYGYRVRACNSLGCGPWSDPPVQYRGAPYACFTGGQEVSCYVGDPIVTR